MSGIAKFTTEELKAEIERRTGKENCSAKEATNRKYKPMCRYGYDDCIFDRAYMKAHHPYWYKELGCPTECEDCKDGSDYDNEDK